MRPSKDQREGDMGFAGMNNTRPERDLTKYKTNQWTGYANDGREFSKPQQPNRKGNDGSCGHSGYTMTGRKPDTAAVPAVPAQGSVRDSIRRGHQVRGGGTAMPQTGKNMFNMGRGPTKGNQQ